MTPGAPPKPPSPFGVLVGTAAVVTLATEWLRFQWGPAVALPVAVLGAGAALAATAGALRARRRWRAALEAADRTTDPTADRVTDRATEEAAPQVRITRGAPARVATATLILPARDGDAAPTPPSAPGAEVPSDAYAPLRSATTDAAPRARTPAPREETP
ncbi:MAG: hypothetical protein RI554_00065 [Trueperaceae bacterium]|nr:hypothetical protein [Trueperaceae bacterium]